MSKSITPAPANNSMKTVPFVSAVPRKYKGYIRDKAIERARTRIIVAGNDPRKLSLEDLEVVVREEEDKIKGSIKEKGLLAVLAMLGLNFFV
jgi:hypothetical protein